MLSRKKTYLLLTATVIVALLHSCAADTAMRKGEKFLAMGEYYDAAEQFKKAYSCSGEDAQGAACPEDGAVLSAYFQHAKGSLCLS